MGASQDLAFSALFILIVPISGIIWPGEPFHALEIGLVLTVGSWTSSLAGLALGKVVDRRSRKKLLVVVSAVNGACSVALGFVPEGLGTPSWLLFLSVVAVSSLFSGGSYPAIVSITNDALPKDHRSEFFGAYGIALSIVWGVAMLASSYLFQLGSWRLYFWLAGATTLASSAVFAFKGEEPRRGAQEAELIEVLGDGTVEYDFELDRETARKTMLSKTNLAALLEGGFSLVLLGILNVLILPYVQTEPHNLSPFSTALFILGFGGIGMLAGQLGLARLSDRLSRDHPERRVKFIAASMTGSMTLGVLFFLIPLPALTVAQGRDIGFLFSQPMMWEMGFLLAALQAVDSMYGVNQGPVIQEINLPEAQGRIAAWNRFLEGIGSGTGPLLAGVILSATNFDYRLSALVAMLFGLPGLVLWILAIRWFPRDREEIGKILEERARILEARKEE
ncbi:MAG: MFS transporter [Promethearchaeota archaeon]